jgi:hypothetical protein
MQYKTATPGTEIALLELKKGLVFAVQSNLVLSGWSCQQGGRGGGRVSQGMVL